MKSQYLCMFSQTWDVPVWSLCDMLTFSSIAWHNIHQKWNKSSSTSVRNGLCVSVINRRFSYLTLYPAGRLKYNYVLNITSAIINKALPFLFGFYPDEFTAQLLVIQSNYIKLCPGKQWSKQEHSCIYLIAIM